MNFDKFLRITLTLLLVVAPIPALRAQAPNQTAGALTASSTDCSTAKRQTS